MGAAVARGDGLPRPRPRGPGPRALTAPADSPTQSEPGFQVHLANFEGPFDLLLSLIAKHRLDITEIALSRVTDEFIAFIRAAGADWDLGQVSEFLLVASTLLDLKAARLLPQADVEDAEDIALLEARDLLFARLLQYRAYKLAAAHLQELERVSALRHPRAASLEPRFAALLPEVVLGVDPEAFARIAAEALRPRPVPQVALEHLHTPRVSVAEHAAVLRSRLAVMGSATFRALTADCTATLEVVARFLALLDLYRERSVTFEQLSALGELHVRWVGGSPDEPRPDDPRDARA